MNLEFTLELIDKIKCRDCNIYLPHSDRHYLSTFALLDDRVKNIYYIEDGWSTWEASINESLAKEKRSKLNQFFSTCNLFLLRLIYPIIRFDVLPRGIRRFTFRLLHVLVVKFVLRNTWISPLKRCLSLVSYPPIRDYECQVDIRPEKTSISNELKSVSAFFLNPRYILDDYNDLINALIAKVPSRELCLIVHPKFCKSSKKILLDKFIIECRNNGFSVMIFNRKNYDEEISFELYDRGCRHFLCCSTTVQVTVDTYKSYFAGLRIDSLSLCIDKKQSFIDQQLCYPESASIQY